MTARPCVRLVPLLVLAASALSAQGEKPLRPFWGTMTGEVRWATTDVCLPHQPVQTRFTAKGELAGLGRATLFGSHCATDDGGAVVHWAGELLPNPAGLLRVGWTKARSLQALAPGTKINITIAPARAGGVVGLVIRMRNLDGADIVSDSVPYPETAAVPAPQP